MSERRAKGCLIAALAWCVILLLLGVGYKILVRKKVQEGSINPELYKEEIKIAVDSFSGYCLFRSEALKQDLKARQIKLTPVDDKADYKVRLDKLRAGEVQLAVFTIDALLTTGAKLGDFPGTIILIVDETKGGDAIVAYQSGLASLQDLNHPDARLVLTPNSPSEFLARVVLAQFSLPKLSEKWLVPADGAAAVFKQLRSASPKDKKAFVLWEPYVSKSLQQKGVQVLLDSAQLKGYIVDVLTVQRQFLIDRPELVRTFIEAYARAAYRYAQQPDGMVKLVMDDARQTGSESLDETQAQKIVRGIQWKNLLENYEHFRLTKSAGAGELQGIADMIENVTDVLIKTKALASDPLGGKPNTLYYDRILAELRAAKFHPGAGLNLIPTPSAETNESIHRPKELATLTPEQWNKLRPVGELRVVPIQFSRGSANINVDSERELQDLARRMRTFSQYYLRIIGHARAEGDPEANRALAQSRAEAAAQYLIGQGIPARQVKTETAPPSDSGGEAQSVTFVAGQVPY
jgi:outer membrane protein OmpA-like peptidoglycan-associated protein/ABC-type nitrate/sulfonate/bicarbonate transport system substrate-binding protein